MEGFALKVEKRVGNEMRNLVRELGIQGRAPLQKEEAHVLIPLVREPSHSEWERLSSLASFELVPFSKDVGSKVVPPYETLRILLDGDESFPKELLSCLPKSWERLGSVLILKGLDQRLRGAEATLAEACSKSIRGVHTVVVDEGGIKGELREPDVRVLFTTTPEAGTVTTHVENGIKYCLDVDKVMFSSGNGTERMHFAQVRAVGEVVVDMFAGIGYFSVPLALFGGVKALYAVEKNPNSFEFLKKNITINGVGEVATAILGDNREVAQDVVGRADRVLMGYIPTPKQFLLRAREFLKEDGGILHYHHTCTKQEFESLALEHVREELGQGTSIKLLGFRVIKNYAPKLLHCVADIWVGRREDAKGCPTAVLPLAENIGNKT